MIEVAAVHPNHILVMFVILDDVLCGNRREGGGGVSGGSDVSEGEGGVSGGSDVSEC